MDVGDEVVPTRTCTGCRRTDEKTNMLRVARTDRGVKADPGGKLPGRGAYVHRDEACLEQAIRRGGLARTLRCRIPADVIEALEGAVRNGEGQI